MRQALRNINEKEISQMLRYFMIATLATPQINGKMDGNILLLKKVASSYWPKIIAGYETAQAEKATLRAKKVEGRIKSLQAQLKEITKPKAKQVSKVVNTPATTAAKKTIVKKAISRKMVTATK